LKGKIFIYLSLLYLKKTIKHLFYPKKSSKIDFQKQIIVANHFQYSKEVKNIHFYK